MSDCIGIRGHVVVKASSPLDDASTTTWTVEDGNMEVDSIYNANKDEEGEFFMDELINHLGENNFIAKSENSTSIKIKFQSIYVAKVSWVVRLQDKGCQKTKIIKNSYIKSQMPPSVQTIILFTTDD